MRRFWAVVIAGVFLSVTAAAGPAQACGCGALAPALGTTAEVTGESAIISHKDGVETIVLSLAVDSAIANAGLIVPTPTTATVGAGDPALFDALHEQTEPRQRIVDDWWGNKVTPPVEQSAPLVVSRVQIGPLEATTLAATDTEGLGTWLSANGYGVPGETASQLQQYVDKKWQFVAVKLVADADSGATLAGPLAPIQITFPTDAMVYPLGMAKAAASEQSLRLNVLGDNRVDVARYGTTDPLNAAVRTVWAGPVSEPALSPLGSYLTVLDLRFDTPVTQITGDIGVIQAPDNDVVDPAVVVVRPIELLGFPLGTLLAVWAALGLIGLLAVSVARSRLR
jgi:hypothetical protein